MKTYIIWKENVHIGDVYSAIKKDLEWNLMDGCSYPEAVETIGEDNLIKYYFGIVEEEK